MKRTLLTPDAANALFGALPGELCTFAQQATVYDSSCSPEARVYFLDREDGYYLKVCTEGTLRAEADMTAYFHAKGLATEVLDYRSFGSKDYLLTRRVRG
ncbi:MAG: aminoglycoside 3'-phosphotransferase, partial [Clostridia bacterium]|nr:aminoglycoside 3'-phosphotransferase [Clostridia bacterium]